MAAASAIAAPFNYGDWPGLTVVYEQVTESSVTHDGTQLFGAPSVIQDTILFGTPGFSLTTSGAGGADNMDGRLDMVIRAKPGGGAGAEHRVTDIELFEYGDYTLSGIGGLGTSATVGAAGYLIVTETVAGPIVPKIINFQLAMSPSDGDWNLQDDGPASLKQWEGHVYIDLDAELAALGVFSSATVVDFVMDNALTVNSEDGTTATIHKKLGGGTSITVTPEPGSIALLLLGAVPLLWRRR
jgi:hypothetical protein